MSSHRRRLAVRRMGTPGCLFPPESLLPVVLAAASSFGFECCDSGVKFLDGFDQRRN